jgi:large subunit ribosomal protein L29
MANREATEARSWDGQRLDHEINDAYRALFTLRFQHASRQLENVEELKRARRRIARLRTLRRERQLQEAREA